MRQVSAPTLIAALALSAACTQESVPEQEHVKDSPQAVQETNPGVIDLAARNLPHASNADVSVQKGTAAGQYQRLRYEEGITAVEDLKRFEFRGILIPEGKLIIDLPPSPGMAKTTAEVSIDAMRDTIFFDFKESRQAENEWGVEIYTTGRLYCLSGGSFIGGYKAGSISATIKNAEAYLDRLSSYSDPNIRDPFEAIDVARQNLCRANPDGVKDNPELLSRALAALARLAGVIDVDLKIHR